ncbi:P-loop containing nucleoside triphosphate hydrolase protein [Absidia repens]|uniref:p-loop containing nucleoside triphosphate hydrolase protein n=1 Tax=Absidia repens TaxID=90262 RepID=A0A1X2IE46_9FUNG|nr:P-loop containing nucleoside triphosphate hydrolase protein [Absidia repens]
MTINIENQAKTAESINTRLTSISLDSQQLLYNPERRLSDNDDGDGDSDGGDDEQRTLKARLLTSTHDDITFLKDNILTRMKDGGGEVLFEIGSEVDGTSMQLTKEEYTQCLKTMDQVMDKLDTEYTDIDTLVTADGKSNDKKKANGTGGHLMIRNKSTSVEDLLEIRVAVVGNVDSGKSTTLGVLTKGILDDGRGKARVNLFRHPHEIESGRTSSVGGEILGFNSKSQVVVSPGNTGRKLTWDEVMDKASKILSFVDLAGHEKYLKTTVFGMTGNFPEFVMLLVGGNAGVIGMAKEHLGLALSLGIPLFVVVTKIDRTPPNVLAETLKNLRSILKSKACQKFPLLVKTNDDVVNSAQHFVSARLCPIFQISNVTGEGLDLLRNYLNILPPLTKYDTGDPLHYEINDIFSVPFVGTVVSGCLKSGVVHVGDKVIYGPDFSGNFAVSTIKSIHRKRVSVPVARAGQSVTFALKNVRRKMVRKGQVLLAYDKDQPLPKVSRRFEAEIRILYHSTTIKQKYQAMVHCGSVRQTAQIINLEQKVLRTGDRAIVQFEFVQHPEYLCEGAKLIFREGRTKGKGTVLRILPN